MNTPERNWKNALGIGVGNEGIGVEREGNAKEFECKKERRVAGSTRIIRKNEDNEE